MACYCPVRIVAETVRGARAVFRDIEQYRRWAHDNGAHVATVLALLIPDGEDT